MRRITFLILFAFISAGVCFAQGEITETFDADGGWVVSGGKAVEKHEDGTYIIKNKERDGYVWAEKEIGKVEKDADFRATVKARLQSISEAGGDNQYGIALGGAPGCGDTSDKSYYVLAVNNDTTYALAEIQNGDTVSYVDWTKHYIVKPGLKSNELSIVKENDRVYYQINGYNIHQTPFTGSYVDKVALLVGVRSAVAFDSLHAEVTAPKKVKVASDALKKDDYMLRNLGSNVNSCFTEILPRLSDDGKQLYVTRMDHPGNLGDETNAGDIWVSALKGEPAEGEEEAEGDCEGKSVSKWKSIAHMGEKVNTQDDGNTDFIISTSEDGNSMFLKGLHGKYHPIYESKKEGDAWSAPQPMKIDDYYNLSNEINICTTSDGKGMILSIERLDSKGGRDLFYSERKGEGWTKPVNLGDVVNTHGDDISPFLSKDNKTLYYSTKGKPGYGGYDIFKTTRKGDSWTEWTEPENLGEVINSPQDDRDYFIPKQVEEDGAKAYMASAVIMEDASCYGGMDIYEVVPVPEEEVAGGGPLAPGKQIRINFDFDKSDIRPEDAKELDMGIVALNKGKFQIEIAGHTDSYGTDAYNQALSERRSEAVYNYMTRNGLDLEKVKVKNVGYGEKYPCDTNKTNEGRFNNRRVLVVILGDNVNSYLDAYQKGNCGSTSFE